MPLGVLAVLAVVVATPPNPPPCNIAPVLSDQFRSSILDLAVDGNDLWAATSYGVALYDRAVDPPRLVASLPLPGTTRLIRLGNGVAYAGSGNTIAVIRKSGRSLQLLRTVDAGAPVNDILFTTLSLYVATRNGITLYSVADPSNPAVLTTFFPNAVTSLAMIGSTLYAVDGDTSVEVFSASPVIQRLGAIATPSNATAVHAQNGKLYVSSAIDTTVFVGSGTAMNNVGSVPFSTTSLAPVAGDALFMSSTDRTVRAMDFSTPGTPIDLFRDEVPVSSGTINRVIAIVTAGNRMYAGSGDSGIVTYDISNFSSPFTMRGSLFANASSVVSIGSSFYVGRTSGIAEFSQSLVPMRTWDGSRADVVQDGATGFLLSSSGASMTLWTLTSTIPQPVGNITFRAGVADAVLIGTTAYAILTDRTLWSADFSPAQPVPQPIATPNIKPSSIARSGNSIAIADNRSDATTLVAYYPTPDFSTDPKTVSVAGLATSGVALSNATAAVQTFRGISLIDFNTLTAGVLPQSNADIARQLILAGSSMLQLTDTSVRIWNVLTQKISAEIALPSQPIAMHVAPQSNALDVVTSTGVVTIALDRILRMPAEIAAPNGNAFYKKVLASAGHIYLFDGRNIDIYSNVLHYIGSVKSAGVVDLAAGDRGLFTLSGNMTVTSYTPDGVLRSTAPITETDAQAVSIHSVNGAVWASIVRGCTSGACEKKTIVFDARSGLNQTVTMTGSVTDVAVNGNRAYAITDLPAELRVIDVSDPFHPSTINSRAADGTPRSIAYSGGTIDVLGNTLATYDETNLAKIADVLGAYSSDGSVTFADQHIRISGACTVVTGRSFAPQILHATSFPSPSPARNVAVQGGTFYILTDHSLEIWSDQALPKPARRAPAR
ncbi:MAG TPA: hypothetical protein VER58_18635 [Thermoanaerobaculia bacterium]|nr:hypothetical protein [Thermoanaerobaculia bacterium]